MRSHCDNGTIPNIRVIDLTVGSIETLETTKNMVLSIYTHIYDTY